MKNRNRAKSGFALIYAIFFIFIFLSLGLAVSYISLSLLKSSDIAAAKRQSFYVAEAGLEYAKYQLKSNPLWSAGFTNQALTDITGNTIGYFTVTIDAALSPVYRVISAGTYLNYNDTVIMSYQTSAGSSEMFKYTVFGDSNITFFGNGGINNGGIHSNASINTMPAVIVNVDTYTSVAAGNPAITKISFDTAGYYNEALIAVQYLTGNREFASGTVSAGPWYIRGDVTIGGVRWWDKNYKRRYRLRIRNNNLWSVNLPIDYSVNIDLDTNSLISAGLLRSDLADLRVVRYNTGSGAYTELERFYMHRTDARGLWFNIIDNIPSNTNNDNYYIYYNNPSAVPPASDPNNIFIKYDTFIVNTSGDYDNGRFLDLHGGGSDNMTYDNVNHRMTFNTGDNTDAGIRLKHFKNELNIVMQCDICITAVYPSNGTFALSSRWRNPNRNVLAHISNGDYPSPQIGTDGTRNADIVDPPGDFYFPANGSVHTLKFAAGHCGIFGANEWSDFYFWVDDILRAGATWNSTYSNQDGRMVYEAAQQRGWIDNIFVRQYISPEPVVTIIPEGNTIINGTVCATGDVILVGQNIVVNNASETYPSIITKSGIYFNGVEPGAARPNIDGLIYAAGNIEIENISLSGSVYGYNVSISGDVQINYNINPSENPFIIPPPYFQSSVSSYTKLKWMNISP